MAGNGVKFFAALVLTWSTDAYGQVLIREGDEWSYFKGTAEPPGDWNTLSFDDSSWERGPSRIGYGDLLDGTQLADMSNGADPEGDALACSSFDSCR